MSVFRLAVLATAFVAANSPVFASLIGDTITGCTNSVFGGAVTTNPAVCDPQAAGFSGMAVVGAGFEFVVAGGVGDRAVDFTGDTVTLIYGPGQGSASADLFVFTNLDWIPNPGSIVGLKLLTTNNLNVTTAFTANSIGLLVNAPQAGAEAVTFQLLVTHVPEPASFALVGLGILAVGIARRKLICR